MTLETPSRTIVVGYDGSAAALAAVEQRSTGPARTAASSSCTPTACRSTTPARPITLMQRRRRLRRARDGRPRA